MLPLLSRTDEPGEVLFPGLPGPGRISSGQEGGEIPSRGESLKDGGADRYVSGLFAGTNLTQVRGGGGISSALRRKDRDFAGDRRRRRMIVGVFRAVCPRRRCGWAIQGIGRRRWKPSPPIYATSIPSWRGPSGRRNGSSRTSLGERLYETWASRSRTPGGGFQGPWIQDCKRG